MALFRSIGDIAANALCTLQDSSGRRVALGLAPGGSTVMAIGRMPASQIEIRAEMAAGATWR